jgi:uncharacterized protein YndB with AHSA1/START domain
VTEIRLDVELAHPPARVWRALTESRHLDRWFLPVVRDGNTFEIRPEHTDLFAGTITGSVLEAVRPDRLVLRLQGDELHVRVTITVEPRPNGCRLTFLQRGFLGPQGTLRRRAMRQTYARLLGERLPEALVGVADPVPAAAGNAPAALRRTGGRLGNARARWKPPARTVDTRVRGSAPVPQQTGTPTTTPGHGLAREGMAWLRSVPGWSAERRSRAVAVGALLLLLIALVMVLVARFTVRTASAPPQVGGADQHGPGFAVVPGQTGPPPATASVPGASAVPWAGPSAGPSAAAGTSLLTATYRTTDRWVGGSRGEVAVANPGTRAVGGWTVTITLPRQTGKTVTFTPVDGAAPVPPGGSVTFDFAVNGVGPPIGCTVDAHACAGLSG